MFPAIPAILAASILPPAAVHLRPLDLAIVGLYLIGITLFGLRFRNRSSTQPNAAKPDRSLRQYFLAGRTIPWWAIALSIVSAETSTLTIISIPGVAFAGDFGFLQIVFGYMVGRILVALIFLPRYFQGELMTAYQLIDTRFGHTLHKVTALLFLLTRAAAEGVRVFAVSIVVGIAIGTRDVLSIAIISALTLLYTFEGGMAAVIWTDVVQMALYVGGTLVAIFTLGAHVPGGWHEIHRVAAAAGKLHLLHFGLHLTAAQFWSTPYTFWAGVLGGTFLTMASHGTDQLMVQRMLAARNLRESRLALLGSGVVIFIQFSLFLVIGAGLYVFYGQHPAAFASPDRIFPTFIVREMPLGISGLLVAAILAAAMSNLSAALNSLSSTSVVDFYMRWRPDAPDTERIMISRASTVLWAFVLFAIAVYSIQAGGHGHVVEVGLSIASVAYGALLGVFLLGTLTRFASQTGAILGMILGFALNLALWLFPNGTVVLAPGTAHARVLSMPHIAFTWYVLIGSIVTFATGAAASLIFRNKRPTPKAAAITAIAILALVSLTNRAPAQTRVPHLRRAALSAAKVGIGEADPPTAANPAPKPEAFAQVSKAIQEAIAQKKIPGAVVLIGHQGQIVFEQAYGNRALEPTVEPMTESTIFDMASLTKVLVTATAVMQLAEASKLDIDAPVATYLPAFAANGKQNVTIRELLTHYSGLPPDVDLKSPWGMDQQAKATAYQLAFSSPLINPPGTVFEYSDINFIVLGALVEKLSGEPLDVYAATHIFAPLGMTQTRYLPADKGCGPIIFPGRSLGARSTYACRPGQWSRAQWVPNTAPTAYDDDLNPAANPDFGHLLRGTVHDPTARRMGGVAGHAGVFSTPADTARFAQALLDKLLRNTGPFPLRQSTLQRMTRPQQPATARADATIFTPDGQLTKGVATRGFGWDLNTAFSRPRGTIFPIATANAPGSFGHTGFTGTSLWLDPVSDTCVILLANAIHPSGGHGAISALRGEVATAAAKALGLTPANEQAAEASPTQTSATQTEPTQTGIEVLEATNFAALKQLAAEHGGTLRLGLLTNQTGLDSHGHRTIDILAHADPSLHLTTLFSPEHGITGTRDSTGIANATDAATGLPILSLYGAKDSDRRPKPSDLAQLDAVVIDLQDAGVRFYTYETVLGYFLEAVSQLHPTPAGSRPRIIVLDRPALIGGTAVQGPVSDPGLESYTNFRPIPVRHGLTLGELARYFNGEGHLEAPLTVIPLAHWHRSLYYDQTGLPWINPSPNLRSVAAATLYPGVAFLETSNVSLGRGTPTPFEHIGADYIHGAELAAYLNARAIPGVRFEATRFPVAEDANHYPFHNQTVEGVSLILTDRTQLDAPELGLELIAALDHLYPGRFNLARTATLIANSATSAALAAHEDPRTIAARWQPALETFRHQREPYLLYH